MCSTMRWTAKPPTGAAVDDLDRHRPGVLQQGRTGIGARDISDSVVMDYPAERVFDVGGNRCHIRRVIGPAVLHEPRYTAVSQACDVHGNHHPGFPVDFAANTQYHLGGEINPGVYCPLRWCSSSTPVRPCSNNLKSNVTTANPANYTTSGEIARRTVTTRILTLAAFSGLIPDPSDLRPDAVNSTQPLKPIHDPETTLVQHCGHNCTYFATFLAPAIKCTKVKSWNTTDIPWNSLQQFMQGHRHHSKSQSPQEVLWVRYHPGVRGSGIQEPVVEMCQCSVARYAVKVDFRIYRFQQPIIEVVDTLCLVPSTEMVFPKTTYLPNRALFGVLDTLLAGNTTTAGVRQSEVTLTTLFSQGIVVSSDLSSSIEAIAQKIIVSLLPIDTDGTTLTHPLLQYAAREQT